MTDAARWWFADLVGALGLTVASTAFLLGGLGGPLRVVAALPLVLVLPGYALVSAMFPRDSGRLARLATFDEDVEGDGRAGSAILEPGLLGRVTLGVLGSLVVVPLATLVVDVSPLPFAARPIALVLGGVTTFLLLIATGRRLALAPADRYAIRAEAVPVPWYSEAGTHRFSRSKWDAALPNLMLVAGALLLLSSVGFAAINPPTHEGFTEFRVETEDMTIETESLYPDTLTAGQSNTLEVVVTNQEGERTRYTVVAVLQDVSRLDGGVHVQSERVVGRTDAVVGAGDERRLAVDIRPRNAGEDRRLLLLLYRGDPPDAVSAETAYRTLRLQVDVGGSG